MAPSEVDFAAVLLFLRRNALSACESALFQDVIDKSRLGLASSEFEKFFFSTPPLKIPETRRELTAGDEGGWTANCSSDDEFVSAVSSVTEFCSSDLANSHGILTTRPASQASSDDKLSQFGTARDDLDFDFRNDVFSYSDEEKFHNHSEDKFMMTVQTGEIEPVEDLFKHKLMLSEYCTDCYEFDGDIGLDKSDEKLKQNCNNHTYCCCGAGRVYAVDLIDYSQDNIKVADANDANLGHPVEKYATIEANQPNSDGFESRHDLSPNKSCQPNETFTDDELIAQEQNKANPNLNEDDSSTTDDDLLTDNNKDDDYEIFNLRIIHRKNRTGFEQNKELPIVLNSVIAGRYYITEFLGSAAFSRVVQAHDLCSGMDVCLKIIKNDKDFFDQSLDEIKLLKYVNKHDPADEHHILRLYDYFYYREHLFIVTELLRANLYEFQKYTQESGAELYFTLPRLQLIALQCLKALLYLHDLGIMHCDLKPENILIKSYRRCEIKVIDLGSSCFQTDKLSLYLQSRSYRAPEVMLGLPYNQKIDLWSLGCILAELYSGEVLFPNEAVVLLLARMIAMLGPIDMDMLEKGEETHKYFTEAYDLYHINEETNELEYIIPDESSLEHHLQITDSLFIEFLKYLLEINPESRPTVREALAHPWLSHTYDDI